MLLSLLVLQIKMMKSFEFNIIVFIVWNTPLALRLLLPLLCICFLFCFCDSTACVDMPLLQLGIFRLIISCCFAIASANALHLLLLLPFALHLLFVLLL